MHGASRWRRMGHEFWSLAIFTLSTFERRTSNCKHYLPLEDGNMDFFSIYLYVLVFYELSTGIEKLSFFLEVLLHSFFKSAYFFKNSFLQFAYIFKFLYYFLNRCISVMVKLELQQYNSETREPGRLSFTQSQCEWFRPDVPIQTPRSC